LLPPFLRLQRDARRAAATAKKESAKTYRNEIDANPPKQILRYPCCALQGSVNFLFWRNFASSWRQKKRGFANGRVFFFWKKNGPISPYLDRQ
jgi:hypothetical protein